MANATIFARIGVLHVLFTNAMENQHRRVLSMYVGANRVTCIRVPNVVGEELQQLQGATHAGR
jgi:hypothetical protein